MSLFESKDVFISEFQNVICERLLKSDGDLEQEVGNELGFFALWKLEHGVFQTQF
jgi:hypothetical protein